MPRCGRSPAGASGFTTASTPRVPAALAGWRSGDLLARAIDDVDALQDLYLRTLLPVAIAVGACVLGTVAVGVILPWAALALGVPLAVALAVPALLTWRRGGDDEMAALAGHLSAQDRRRAGRRTRAAGLRRPTPPCWRDIEELGGRTWTRSSAATRGWPPPRRSSSRSASPSPSTAVLALGVAAVHAHHLGPGHGGRAPPRRAGDLRDGARRARSRWPAPLAVRASADRLFALDDVPVPVRDPAAPVCTRRRGCPRCDFDDAALRYGPGLPRALDGVSLRPPGRRAGSPSPARAAPASRASSTRCCATGRSRRARSSLGGHRRRAPGPDRRHEEHVRAGGPAGADVRRHRSLQPDPRPPRRDGRRARRRAARGRGSTRGWPRCPRGSRRRSARTASPSRVASGGAWPWPAPCCRPGPVLVLDEPTSGLDAPLGRRARRGRAWRTRRPPGRSVLVITHRPRRGGTLRRRTSPSRRAASWRPALRLIPDAGKPRRAAPGGRWHRDARGARATSPPPRGTRRWRARRRTGWPWSAAPWAAAPGARPSGADRPRRPGTPRGASRTRLGPAGCRPSSWSWS